MTSISESATLPDVDFSVDNRLRELEAHLRQMDRTIAGMQHFLKIAADYVNEDPAQTMAAIQAALGKAAEYKGREQKRRGNGR